jgi:hypothetical protein
VEQEASNIQKFLFEMTFEASSCFLLSKMRMLSEEKRIPSCFNEDLQFSRKLPGVVHKSLPLQLVFPKAHLYAARIFRRESQFAAIPSGDNDLRNDQPCQRSQT